jgi:hypothetical protein
MPTTIAEISRDTKTHHRLSLFELADLKSIESSLFEKNGKAGGARAAGAGEASGGSGD